MSVASLLVLVVAVQQSGSDVRAGGIALGSWFPAAVTVLGALIAVRQPENKIAWFLIGIGFAVLVELCLQLLLSTQPISASWQDIAAIVLVHVALPAAIYLAFLIPLIFPNGRFYGRWQRRAAWPGAVMLFVLPITVLFTEEIGQPYPAEGEAWTVENSPGFLPSSTLDIAIGIGILALVLTAVSGVLSLIIRYRRSSVVIRAQIRWILFATSIVAGVFVLILVTEASQNAVGGLLLVVAFITMPVCITVAITRYRLFEIDRIISRTLSYTVLVAILAAAFFGLVTATTAFLPAQDSLVVAASTLAIAALFNPLRKRVQKALDRRFNRSAYHAEVIMGAFGARLSERLSTTEIVEEWHRTVDEFLEPETIGTWIRHN
jgi:hypothetical protein